MSSSASSNPPAFIFEPTEFRDHVRIFDHAFKCYPKTTQDLQAHLTELNGGEPITTALREFVESLQAQAAFGLRLALIVEETGEWCEARLKSRGSSEEENELADLEYVLHGAGDTLGYNMDAARGRIAAKNQHKIENAAKMQVSAAGKIIKPEDQANA